MGDQEKEYQDPQAVTLKRGTLWVQGKGKGSPWHLVQSCLTLGRSAHPCFQAIEPVFCPKTVSVVMWPARLGTECCYLPTEVVPIYLLAFLHIFKLLGWQELGQAPGPHSVTWIWSYDCWPSDLAAQRCLWFNPQYHHTPQILATIVNNYSQELLSSCKFV